MQSIAMKSGKAPRYVEIRMDLYSSNANQLIIVLEAVLRGFSQRLAIRIRRGSSGGGCNTYRYNFNGIRYTN